MIHQIEAQVLILLLVATLVGLAARRVRLPYTLALVVAGLLLGFVELPALSEVELSADLLLLLLLPALLFEAAFHIEWADFRRELAPVLMLAIVGVTIAVALTGGLLYAVVRLTGLAPGFGLEHAFVFGAVIAATDPISVLALFRELGVTRRLYLLVEGESLLNDGVAVVAFFIVLALFGISWGGEPAPVLEGAREIVSHTLVTFVKMALGGALMGAVIGGLVSLVTRHIDDHLLEVTLTTLVAYGSFFLAESLHLSGVLSAVTAGLIVGSVAGEHGMSPHTKRAVEDFWEYMAFLANSFIFLLVGLELELAHLAGHAILIIVAFAAMLCARATVVYSLVPLANRFAAVPVPGKWRHVMFWGGLRGSLSMVLVLTLPADFVGRDVLINVVFGTVALSLFVQGLSVKKLLQHLGLLRGRNQARGYERARAKVLVATRALAAAEELYEDGLVSRQPYERLRAHYQKRLELAEALARERAGASQLDAQLVEGLHHLGEIERLTLRHAASAGLIGDETAAELDAHILRWIGEVDEVAASGEELSALLERLSEVRMSEEE